MIKNNLSRVIDIQNAVESKNDVFLSKKHTVNVRIKSNRSSGKIGFISCSDGSSFIPLQIVYNKETFDDFEDLKKFSMGATIECVGTIKLTPDAKQSFDFEAISIELLGDVAEDYPLQKNRIGFEKLREIPHLRPRTNTFEAVFKVRSALSMAIHYYFQSLGFQYVTPPIITINDAEGAGEAFTVTTRSDEKYDEDFFGRRTSLTVSGQLHIEPFALALGNVYSFGPTFRAENSNTPYHASEFWMIEPEISSGDLFDNIQLIEGMIKYCISYVLEKTPNEMNFLNEYIDKNRTLIEDLKKTVSSDFKIFTYDEAVTYLLESNKEFEFPVNWGMDFKSEHERYLCEVKAKSPVFVINYPKEIKPFYMRLNDDGKTVAACDLLVPGVGELIGGSQREERYDVLIDRMAELGIPIEPLEWYVDLRRYGTIKHSGFGIGLERLMLFITRIGNIRDTIPYARTPKNCRF